MELRFSIASEPIAVCQTVGSFPKYYRLFSIMIIFFCFGCKDRDKIISEHAIVSFTIKNSNVKEVSINQNTGQIDVRVSYGTLLSNRFPDIILSDGATIVPSSSAPQDFSKVVYYTVTGADGSKKVYKVVVAAEGQPNISIQGFSKDTIQAGDTVLVFGKHFGPSISLLTINLLNSAGSETKISARLIDSTQLRLPVSSTLQPGNYRVSISRNNIKVLSNQLLTIRIPNPEVTDLKSYHLRQGDTLVLAGNYITGQFNYGISLSGNGSNSLRPFLSETGKLSAVISSEILPGNYQVSINNLDEKTKSKPFAKELTIYSNKLPFITGILFPKSSYTAGESVVFKTVNFPSIATRFYSVQLTGQNKQYNQNGIYASSDATLSITLPTDITSSNYSIQVIFLDSSGNQIYQLELDDQLVVNL